MRNFQEPSVNVYFNCRNCGLNLIASIILNGGDEEMSPGEMEIMLVFGRRPSILLLFTQ